MGLEALSRGANHATFVDNSRESIHCIHANLEALGIKKSGEVIYADVFEVMKKLAKKGRQFDMIYADPPYANLIKGSKEMSWSAQVVAILDELIELKLSLLKAGGILFLEDAMESLPENKIFKNLTLKDERNMGRSALQHWTYSPLD